MAPLQSMVQQAKDTQSVADRIAAVWCELPFGAGGVLLQIIIANMWPLCGAS